ncbi:MAG: transporter substrate-binding domain-containing protein, partial [Kiritimatiellia bacterium]|nr:transporter substrate-binding domain-containing protein [Kiritimatiellia bacterium]
MNNFKRTGVLILMPILLLTAAAAVYSAPAIKVGIAPSPPFAMKNLNGEWEGISIDLWKAVTEKLGLASEYQECDYAELVQKLSAGALDAGLGRLSALELHNPSIDFTHAFYFSGLAFATNKMTERQHWMAVLLMLRENNFILLVFMIGLTLALAGISIWLLEHRHNPGHFSKNQ